MPTVLGIESTAHTFGIGIIQGNPQENALDCQILANERALYRPPPPSEQGEAPAGIHPRKAADHHAKNAKRILQDALDAADVPLADVDLIAFSQAPGLGPSLRTGATIARALSLHHEKTLIGVNHCIAHLEIGRALCDVDDPLLLYASGANTQIIAYAQGRYRVFGETLDIGIGNHLDKLARRMGQPFPGGPEIERLAAQGQTLLDLPYTVKGMDVAFSGQLTAAATHLDNGKTPSDVAYSVQETAYAMLTEVTERALAHVGKSDVVLGGGVACNERLTGMVNTMCAQRGARAHRPQKDVLVDNGAMIAWTGLIQHASDQRTPIPDSQIDQNQRTDHVAIPWRNEGQTHPDPTHGAEATIHLHDGQATKTRPAKGYRHPALDARLRAKRTRDEAHLIAQARHAGAKTPYIHDVDPARSALTMQRVEGDRLRDALDGLPPKRQREALEGFGHALGTIHEGGIAHGDPTTSNAFLQDEHVVLIDFGLAYRTRETEDHATDLHVLHEALEATHREPHGGFDAVLAGYTPPHREAVLRQLETVRSRGRYR